jgi:hypothetical protein
MTSHRASACRERCAPYTGLGGAAGDPFRGTVLTRSPGWRPRPRRARPSPRRTGGGQTGGHAPSPRARPKSALPHRAAQERTQPNCDAIKLNRDASATHRRPVRHSRKALWDKSLQLSVTHATHATHAQGHRCARCPLVPRKEGSLVSYGRATSWSSCPRCDGSNSDSECPRSGHVGIPARYSRIAERPGAA